jgi:signal transduction histidine kinase/CheY-like chemotaxis protein
MSAISLGAVLILEDDPGVNRLQCKQLERSGYAVASSATTEEALEKIQAGGIDLIVLDYNLSGPVSGVEFYRRLQVAGYNLPAILVTGFSDEARLIEALRAGVRDFLPKTADFIEYLASTVERVMRQVRAERKAIESEELRQKEERFRTSVENMLDCFGIYSAMRGGAGQIVDFRIDYVNAAACESNHLTKEQQMGRELRSAEETSLERALFEPCVRVVESGVPFSVDGLRLECAGKPVRWFDIRIAKLSDGFVATWRDVSARMQAETELARAKQRAEQASRAKDEFLATVSHELRTPLNAILGWVQLLGVEDIDAATKADAVLTIERNAKSQARLIEDLIDISRIISGKLRLEVQTVDLHGIIEAALDAARPAANARSLSLDVSLDPAAREISGDPDRLQQIVWNLLSNAIKFTPTGGWVRVRLGRADEAHVEIAVSDSGKGIEPTFLPFVFERFSQAETSSTRHYSGLGLGLAITRHLVELHGGAIEAASEGEGQGATFRVRLPLVAIQNQDSQPVERTAALVEGERLLTDLPRDLEGIKVVAVDDDADARSLLQTVLTYCKATATVVATADAAFEAVRRVQPDVLLSDIEMAGEDGYSLIRRVRALGPENGGDTPAAAMTAYARMEDRARALEAGFQLHVSKPVEAAELVAVVTRLAGKSAA